MNKPQPKIVILMPMVWAARNVVYSGVLHQLKQAGVQAHLLMLNYDADVLANDPAYAGFQDAASIDRQLPPTIKSRVKGRSFLREVTKDAYNRRNQIASYPIYNRWNRRHATASQRFRTGVIGLAGTLTQPTWLYETLTRWHERLHCSEFDLAAIKAQLEALKPDLIWSTANIYVKTEYGYLFAAQELNIPIVTSILSFDNLTSKQMKAGYDHYLVWNERMCRELQTFYPHVGDTDVTITGTPQFDFHRKPDYLWTRADTLETLELPADARYFLYAAGASSLVPEEPELVHQWLQRLRQHPRFKDYWVVIRHHPRFDERLRWVSVMEAFDKVVLSSPWSVQPDPDLDYWAIPRPQDMAKLTSSLAHTDACINIASTISLDAAILDRPVICPRMDGEPDAPRDLLYDEYDTTHYAPLVASGGITVVNTWDEWMAALTEAIDQPERRREARARMVREGCGLVDGQAADRVTETLLAQI